MVKKTRSLVIAILCVPLWLAAVGFGFGFLVNYQKTAGTPADPSRQWPETSRVSLSKNRPTLLLFAHPRCPCTTTTVAELTKLLTRTNGKLDVYVIFFRPKGSTEAWVMTPLWRSARAIPGVRVISDENRIETNRFGVKTSGTTIVYDRDGQLRFHGGITAARGHAGDNAGRSAIVSLVNDQEMERSSTPVFGCSLVEPRLEDRADEVMR